MNYKSRFFLTVGILFSLLIFVQAFSWAEEVFSLFTTPRASKVGDTVTVIISEFSTATQIAKTDFARSSQMEGEAGLNGGFSVNGGLDYSNKYAGSGATKRQGSVNARITAEVVEVLPTGNLKIRGSKKIVVNQEEQIIFVEGVVRPQDIGKDNTVFSTKLAHAVISLKGRGVVNESRKPGIIARILGWLGIL